ncbi:hypothetical protein AAMO2058_000701000 [Amorphochlora amoebiformis]
MTDKLEMSLSDIISSKRSPSNKAPTRAQNRRANRRNNTPYGNGRGRGTFRSTSDTTVFVGNLDWSVKWQDLKDHMAKAGEVEFADVLTHNDGKSAGAGLVRYTSAAMAKRAIKELTDSKLNGRLIFVREDREAGKGGGGGGGKGGDPSRTVFVGNLSWGVAWQDLKDHMKEVGDVEYAEVLTRSDGKSAGGGLVRYASVEGAERAIRELTDTELQGRLIFVREDREGGHIKGSGRYGDGGGFGGGFGGGAQGFDNEVSVYVGNVPFTATWQTIKDAFADYGVLHVDVGEARNNRMRGWAILKFGSTADAEAAIKEMNGAEIEGREIFVKYDGGGK